MEDTKTWDKKGKFFFCISVIIFLGVINTFTNEFFRSHSSGGMANWAKILFLILCIRNAFTNFKNKRLYYFLGFMLVSISMVIIIYFDIIIKTFK